MVTNTTPTVTAEANTRQIIGMLNIEADTIRVSLYDDDKETYRLQRALWEREFLRLISITMKHSPEAISEYKEDYLNAE